MKESEMNVSCSTYRRERTASKILVGESEGR
jgi:hypothetical protein